MSLWFWIFGLVCLAIGCFGLFIISQEWTSPRQYGTQMQEKEDEPL